MDNGFRESVHHDAACMRVPPLIVPLGCTGRWIRSILRRVPFASTRRSAYTAGAVAARRRNRFAILLMGTARGVVHLIRGRST